MVYFHSMHHLILNDLNEGTYNSIRFSVYYANQRLTSSFSFVFVGLANPYGNVSHHVSVKIPCHFNIPLSSSKNCVPVFKAYIRLVFMYVYIYITCFRNKLYNLINLHCFRYPYCSDQILSIINQDI
jgi:hypothetical protein